MCRKRVPDGRCSNWKTPSAEISSGARNHVAAFSIESVERPACAPLFCGPHFKYAKFANFGSYVRTVRVFRMSGSPVAVRAGASLLGRWLLPRVRQHSALSAVSWRSDLCGAVNTQHLRRQNFCSRWTSLVELSSSPTAQSRHHLRTVQTTITEGTFVSGSTNTALCDFWYATPYLLTRHEQIARYPAAFKIHRICMTVSTTQFTVQFEAWQ